MANDRKDQVLDLLEKLKGFQLCGPSDDPDEITSVTSNLRYLTIQLKRTAAPFLPDVLKSKLESIVVAIDDLYSANDAKAELDALAFDIEQILNVAHETANNAISGQAIVDPSLVRRLQQIKNDKYDISVLVELFREINSSFSNGNFIATVILMRNVLNYIPPIFGHETFEQVSAQAGKSLKHSFGHLQDGLRKIADYHAHRQIGKKDIYPSRSQIDPFKPQFEILVHEVISRLSS